VGPGPGVRRLIPLRVLAGLAGAAVVAGTLRSAIQATILPRGVRNGFAHAVVVATVFVFRLVVRRSASYAARDRTFALLGPVSMIVLLAAWLVTLLTGFCLLYLADGARDLGQAVRLSGSSAFTLGTTAPGGLAASLLTYLEAGLGLLIVTLLITYLPSMYAAFSRREIGVNLLRSRAGDPPRAATLLVRYWQIEQSEVRLRELWQTWETWFADLEETHTTFAVLPFFRSPQPEQSWVTAAGVLLDTAAMWLAAVEHPRDPDAALCLRTGFLALRRVAASLGIPADDDPAPDDPISITEEEWTGAVEEMAAAGVPVTPDRQTAWRAWRGWRVNYDTALLRLARAVEAPNAPWVSDRSPVPTLATPRRWRSPLRR
jgi:hypothetical protein